MLTFYLHEFPFLFSPPLILVDKRASLIFKNGLCRNNAVQEKWRQPQQYTYASHIDRAPGCNLSLVRPSIPMPQSR